MNFNKYRLKIGDFAILDAGFNNASKVKIIGFTFTKMFATVHLADKTDIDSWEVMTTRLSKLTE